jgi:hypothetical protein
MTDNGEMPWNHGTVRATPAPVNVGLSIWQAPPARVRQFALE